MQARGGQTISGKLPMSDEHQPIPADAMKKALATKSATIAKRAHSIEEMAARYDSSRTAIKEEIRAGRLVARKFGRRTIILDEDERAWANSLPRVQPAAAV
jgi:hypothetical protein